jgi:hypothetical protein
LWQDASEAAARVVFGCSSLCGTCRQRLSGYQQGEHSDLLEKLRRQIDMIAKTAKKLSRVEGTCAVGSEQEAGIN